MATEESIYHGKWKIVECVSLAGTVEPTGIEGTEFHLDESGDVSWKMSEDAEPMPFFTCETYKVAPASGGEPAILKFFGTFAGHVIEFRVNVSDDLMLLTYERCCMLQCQKISSCDHFEETPFSFLGALLEGYFSDMVIKADSGKEFKVHEVILKLGAAGVDWNLSPPPLSGLREDVLFTTLYYLYSECLPRGLSEDTAKLCIKEVGKLHGFEKFNSLCETFLKNTALKQQMNSLVSDMHACGDRIIDLFSGKGDGSQSPNDTLLSNPARLCYVAKQALREGAVACAKFLILCDLFSRRKGELSREERHDIIKYAKSRLPIFMNQLHKFLEVCKQHCSELCPSQRNEITSYLVPEIETSLETITKFVIETTIALEQVISNSSASEKLAEKSEKHKKRHVGDVLGRTLKHALHMRELMKLRNFHDKTTASLLNLKQKKDNFSSMSDIEKVRSVSKNLEQLIDEVPLFLYRLEELMGVLDDKVTWREWKYLFKLGTSKVAWGLGKVLTHKKTLKSMINRANEIVNRDQFTSSLISLGLLDPPAGAEGTAANISLKPALNTKYVQLSSIESICTPPYAKDSVAAQRALELLRKAERTDMTIEIITVHDQGDIVIDHTQGEPIERSESERDVDIYPIKAHCVIIAARCDWFRRALLSGMRESIDKKITVHDTNPELFKLFLEYLYSGQLEVNDFTTEQLVEMMTLADRYEVDSLASLCEHSLKHHIDEDTALYLLSLADQLNVQSLKESTLSFIKDHPGIVHSDVFEDLPNHLQTAVEDALTWNDIEPNSQDLSGNSSADPNISIAGVLEVDELMGGVDLGEARDLSTSISPEEYRVGEDSARLEACLEALLDIVGDTVPRDELVRIALAADYDINRALNFFFSS